MAIRACQASGSRFEVLDQILDFECRARFWSRFLKPEAQSRSLNPGSL
jgi:hypothetical protein